ncbi:DUF6198 family protein [Bacillus sp. B15-48]|uniref:YczE/YyaS/YitT family protein n=1 Tax=Bacillus sp. B15-48 TaxID=1548601 RepID=UPI00193F9C3E|nr:DUF6198 family protein [Bacillus sp. B15-48]MBM4760959.1 hypothetical protein [Bacillus sp. B15-48]
MSNLVKVRLYFYFVGILVLSLGLTLSVYSQLGASPMPSLLVGMQQLFGLTVGSWEVIIGACLLVIISLVRRTRLDILAFFTSFIAGVAIDLWMYIIKQIYIPDLLLGKILYIIFGLVFIGIGVAMYLQSKFSPSPPDAMMLLIHEYMKLKLSTSRTLFSVIIVVSAYLIGGPIGIGTWIMVFGMGPVIGYFYPSMEKYFKKLSDSVQPLDDEKDLRQGH